MKSLLTQITAAALIHTVVIFSAAAAPCAAGTADDFTYRTTVATNCVADGGNPGNSFSFFGSSYTQLVKFDLSQAATVGTVYTGNAMPFGTAPNNGTITFGLKFLGLGGDGYYGYELVVTDTPESLLPALLDLVGMVKQSNGYQAYEFDSAYVGDTGNLGTFKSLFGPNANNGFSHFSIYGTNYQACTPTTPGCTPPLPPPPQGAVPEPGSLALASLALLGLGISVSRRRRV